MSKGDGILHTLIKRRTLLMIALPAALAAGVFAPGSALAGTLDQQQTSADVNGAAVSNGLSLAQTFTAGISGGLDQVDLWLQQSGTPPPSTVEIRDTSAGIPGTAVLATASLPGSALGPPPGTFIPVTFAAPAPVTAGTQYAIVLYNPGTGGNGLAWSFQNSGDPYQPGGIFQSSDPLPPGGNWTSSGVNNDLAFKTYVTPVTQVTPGTGTDKTPPETTIGSKKIRGTTAKFTFSSSEPGSSFQCKLDKRAFRPCSSPKKYKHLSDGKHKFKVGAVDAAGNVDPSPAKTKFKI